MATTTEPAALDEQELDELVFRAVEGLYPIRRTRRLTLDTTPETL